MPLPTMFFYAVFVKIAQSKILQSCINIFLDYNNVCNKK